MRETILEARRVTKSFPIRAGLLRRAVGEVRAVDGVDLAVSAGGTVGLVGESGSGKSTLARIMIGLMAPTGGEVLAQGAPLAGLRGDARRAFHRHVAMIFQDPTNSLDPRQRVEAIVAEPLRIHRLATGRALDSRIDALLETVRLSPRFRRRRPRELSGGERQRVGIARALATDPKLLVCDEPIASLDVSVGAQILELLGQLRVHRGLALLMISHDLRAVAYLCETIAVMSRGKLVEQGPTAKLIEQPNHPYTQLLLRCASLDLSTDLSQKED